MADGVEPSTVTEATEAEGVVLEAAGLQEIDTRTILRAGGPRFAANAGFPVLFFYAGWKLSGLLLGMFLGVSSYSAGPLTGSAFSIVVLGGLGSVSGSFTLLIQVAVSSRQFIGPRSRPRPESRTSGY